VAGNGQIGNEVIIISMEKQRYFYNHKSQAVKSTVWSVAIYGSEGIFLLFAAPSQQIGEIIY